MEEHTLGPWRVGIGGNSVRGANGNHVCLASRDTTTPDISGDERWEIALANARLIAAAPELLEALKAVVNNDDVRYVMSDAEYEATEAAIAKATP